jgi:hypothetical protein
VRGWNVAALSPEPEFLNFQEAKELIPKKQFRQAV